MSNLCVFCGSAHGNDRIYTEVAQDLVRQIVERGHGLVYGAGHVGLMGVIADAVLEANGSVIGVIPQDLVDRELAHERLTELHIVETMHQRKALMADRSDAFLAIPGGVGTADELFEILTWRQLKIHDKPIGILNVQGFFDPLLAWIQSATEQGFIRPRHRNLFVVKEDVSEILDLLLEVG